MHKTNCSNKMDRTLVCACADRINHFTEMRRLGVAGIPLKGEPTSNGRPHDGRPKMKLYLHKLIYNLSTSEAKAEYFNFRTSWHLIEPHLNNPRVQAALKRGMEDYFAARAAECIRLGINAQQWQITYDPRVGPWQYCLLDPREAESEPFGGVLDNTEETVAHNYAHRAYFWEDRAAGLTNEAIATGALKWNVRGDEPTAKQWEEYDEFENQFYPREGTYQWYQLQDRGSYWLAGWLKELGELVFPELEWHGRATEQSGHAEGRGEGGQFKIIFDILHFEPVDEFGRPVQTNN
jgi:hypothetical protein